MEINISGIIIEVRKKKIKNMYLSVKPPDGRVVISAPISMNRRTIEASVRFSPSARIRLTRVTTREANASTDLYRP